MADSGKHRATVERMQALGWTYSARQQDNEMWTVSFLRPGLTVSSVAFELDKAVEQAARMVKD